MAQIYYTPPTDKVFNEVREKAMKLWEEVDTDNDKFGYATEKKNRIKDIQNVGDNLMYIVAMFDMFNQRTILNRISDESRQAIKERMIDGGNSEEFIRVLGL